MKNDLPGQRVHCSCVLARRYVIILYAHMVRVFISLNEQWPHKENTLEEIQA